MLAQKAPVLPDIKANPVKEKHKRYDSSEKGKARHKRYRMSPKGRYNKLKSNLRYRRNLKVRRVEELKKELLQYDKENSNRAGAGQYHQDRPYYYSVEALNRGR